MNINIIIDVLKNIYIFMKFIFSLIMQLTSFSQLPIFRFPFIKAILF